MESKSHTMSADCYLCLARQGVEAARNGGADDARQVMVLRQVLDLLSEVTPADSPPDACSRVHRLVRAQIDHGDPYRAAKQASTNEALALLPRLKSIVAASGDPLDAALRLSIAGNIIDVGSPLAYDLWDTIERVLVQRFAVDDRVALERALDRAERVLYLADNAGETVFDRVLIEVLGLPVVYAVKGGPILNDATMEDALAAGLDHVARVVSNGADAIGTWLPACSAEFRELFGRAELIIAKGQANYETLYSAGARVFFLLQTKCPTISRLVGVPPGSIVLKQGA